MSSLSPAGSSPSPLVVLLRRNNKQPTEGLAGRNDRKSSVARRSRRCMSVASRPMLSVNNLFSARPPPRTLFRLSRRQCSKAGRRPQPPPPLIVFWAVRKFGGIVQVYCPLGSSLSHSSPSGGKNTPAKDLDLEAARRGFPLGGRGTTCTTCYAVSVNPTREVLWDT